MKQIDTSTYNFPEIIANDFLYIDKTSYVWRLIQKQKGEYFLSRPRRFGKSLLVSTLKAVFQGRRELFKGLAIDKMAYDWKTYPVIHLNFGACMASTPAELSDYLLLRLQECADEYKLTLRQGIPQERFIELIKALSKNVQVVVLVDEYDKPILSNIANQSVSDILRLLKGFYSVIKTYEGFIRFAFITGVSKFAHVSLFSDLNNLTDITLQPDYSEMLGFTEADIRRDFADRLLEAAEKNNLSQEGLMEKLLTWYDGYRFSDADTHVCNPVSIAKFFGEGYRFANYWENTGTPSFLLELARERNYDYETALNDFYDESVFAAYELDRLEVTGLLWQTGYLTIKEVVRDEDGMLYRLDFPDKEVQATFNQHLIEFFAGNDRSREAWSLARRFRTAIRQDDLDGFMRLFQAFLASISYDLHLNHEKFYQTIFFVVFKLLGASIEAESQTNQGRIDAYIRTSQRIYIFEFKLNKTAETAISQIIDRRYYEMFCQSGLPISLIGVNFNSTKGQIDNWAETTLSR